MHTPAHGHTHGHRHTNTPTHGHIHGHGHTHGHGHAPTHGHTQTYTGTGTHTRTWTHTHTHAASHSLPKQASLQVPRTLHVLGLREGPGTLESRSRRGSAGRTEQAWAQDPRAAAHACTTEDPCWERGSPEGVLNLRLWQRPLKEGALAGDFPQTHLPPAVTWHLSALLEKDGTCPH